MAKKKAELELTPEPVVPVPVPEVAADLTFTAHLLPGRKMAFTLNSARVEVEHWEAAAACARQVLEVRKALKVLWLRRKA